MDWQCLLLIVCICQGTGKVESISVMPNSRKRSSEEMETTTRGYLHPSESPAMPSSKKSRTTDEQSVKRRSCSKVAANEDAVLVRGRAFCDCVIQCSV